LIKAVIKRESRFKPNARGAKGEIGLMQVTPAVGMECAFEEKLKKFKLEDLYDPALNVHVGAWYLAKAIKRYEAFPDPAPFALAHYNAGASNVDRWLEATNNRGDKDEFLAAITYPGTKSYIEYILNKWRWYKLTSF
jgi:soluble lytic murein transglycosylase